MPDDMGCGIFPPEYLSSDFRKQYFYSCYWGTCNVSSGAERTRAFHYIVSRGLLIVNGIPVEDGLAYALLTHESQLIFVAIIGAISFFIIFRKEKKSVPPVVQPPN